MFWDMMKPTDRIQKAIDHLLVNASRAEALGIKNKCESHERGPFLMADNNLDLAIQLEELVELTMLSKSSSRKDTK